MKLVVACITLQATGTNDIAAEQESSPSPPDATPPPSLVANVSSSFPASPNRLVEAARTAVEEVIAGAAMDLVIAAEREHLVVAAGGEDPSSPSVPVITSSPLVPAMTKSVLSKSSTVKLWTPLNSTTKSLLLRTPSSLLSAIRKVLLFFTV